MRLVLIGQLLHFTHILASYNGFVSRTIVVTLFLRK